MKEIIHIEPLTIPRYDTYIKVGTQAYSQHYLHLWVGKDPAPYLKSSFTIGVLRHEERDLNTSLFIINRNGKAIGILKFTIDCKLDTFSEKEALYVDKIYILHEHSGKGVGKKVLQFVMLRAQEHYKDVVWLDTMRNGPALNFYIKNGFEIHSERLLHFPEVLEKERPMFVLTKKIEVF